MPWRGPSYKGELPTLGYQVIDWLTENLAAPDRGSYEPFVLTREQAQFVLNLYLLNPGTGKRVYRRAVLSRPKGWGKSPLLGALACVEALGPVVPAGWDADGEPVAHDWSVVRTPWVQIAAVSEDQTRNAWMPLLEMLRDGPVLDNYPGLEPMESFVNLPRGRIEFVTSASVSREGNRPVFCVLDQTEAWTPSNGGVKLAATLRRNLGKTSGCSVESPNAFVPGEGSVAENSADYARQITEGRAVETSMLWDHREAPPETDLVFRDSLLAGLKYAYGDSDWVDLDRVTAEVWDPATDPQDARRFYLNQITHATDSWLSQPEWASCFDPGKVVADREQITLGFDGSRSRTQRSEWRGTTDATALIACRLSDGHLWPIGIWEQPEGPAGREWRVPVTEVDAAVRSAFARYRVIGFYADPAKWEGWVSGWESAYRDKLKVKMTAANPIEWWMTGGRLLHIVRALEQFHSAVVERELSHDGDYVLTRHMLNARRRIATQGVTIAKEHPDSPRKIDGAIAAVLAWQARLDAISKGFGRSRGTGRVLVLP